MTVRDLKRLLDELDDDVEVRIASQPNWPFEYSCEAAFTNPTERYEVTYEPADAALGVEHKGFYIIDCSEDAQDEDHWVEGPFETHEEAVSKLEHLMTNHTPILYIAENQQLGYLPGEARKAVGW